MASWRSRGWALALGATIGSASTPIPAHPVLLFGPADEPALAAKVQSGVAAQAYASMASYCWFSQLYEDYWAKCLEEVALRYRLSGEASYAANAAATLGQVVTTDPTTLPIGSYPEWLLPAPVPVALAYDWIYDASSDAEREAVRGWLEQYAVELWAYTEGGTLPPITHRATTAYAALGWVALAIQAESTQPEIGSWLDTAVEQLGQVAFLDGYNPGGSYDGGYGYGGYAAPLAIRFAEAYRRASGVDLLAGSNLEQAPAWYVYGWLPHRGYAAFGGGISVGGAAYGGEHLLLVDRTQSTLGKWGFLQIHGSQGVDDLFRPLLVSDRVALALYYPDQVADILDPRGAGYPLGRFFPDTANPSDGHVGTALGRGGLGVLRTGWTTDAVAALVKVSDEWQPYSHNDSSSFVLSAYGAEMAMDPGPGPSLTRRSDHNVVLVGGRDDGATERTSYRGQLEAMGVTELVSFVRADARYPAGEHLPGDPDDLTDDQWAPVARSERTVALVQGARPYLVVADAVSADGQTAEQASWLMHLGRAGYLLAGSGSHYDPFRFEFASGAQLLVGAVEPGVPAEATVAHDPETFDHQIVTLRTVPAVENRLLVILQPLRSGAEEVPLIRPVTAYRGVAVELAWSDGADLLLWRHDEGTLSAGATSTDARFALVRYDPTGNVAAWMVAEGATAVVEGRSLIATGGLEVTASLVQQRLEVHAAQPPAARQIAAFAPLLTEARLDGQPVRFVRAGAYALLPAPCEPTERCNGIDDDCDELVDEPDAVDAPAWYRDADGDGYGTAADSTRACAAPEGYAPHGTDCDDGDDDVHPGRSESCADGVDDDCDGAVDRADPDCADYGSVTGSTGGCRCGSLGAGGRGGRGVGPTWVVPLLLLRLRRRSAWGGSAQLMRRT